MGGLFGGRGSVKLCPDKAGRGQHRSCESTKHAGGEASGSAAGSPAPKATEEEETGQDAGSTALASQKRRESGPGHGLCRGGAFRASQARLMRRVAAGSPAPRLRLSLRTTPRRAFQPSKRPLARYSCARERPRRGVDLAVLL